MNIPFSLFPFGLFCKIIGIMSFIQENIGLFSEICKCIAMEFGRNCEVVLHDLTLPYGNTIVAIFNGHVTNRKVGDGGTNAGLELLRSTTAPEDQYNFINKTDNGRILRSSSKYICIGGKAVGSICINWDITDLLSIHNAVDSIVFNDNPLTIGTEIFSGNIDTTLDLMMQRELTKTGKDISQLTKDEKSQIVNNLDKMGAFLIKKSVERVAEFLDISRFTIYNYLNAKDKKATIDN